MKKKAICTLLLVSLLSIIFPFTILKGSAAEFNFGVETVVPKNQVDKKKTYFDLLVEPGQKQILEINLRNDTDDDVKINPLIHSATTNLNGVVEYGENDKEADPTLLYKLEDIVKTEEEVIIPAKGNYVLKLDVTVPKKEFDGVVAGGIILQEDTEGTDEKQNKNEDNKGLSIKNEFAYVVAILLRENENEIKPELQLNDVFPDQVNARNVINVNIQNTMPMYMNQMTVKSKVTKKDDSQVLYESNKEGMQMAPNSNFDYPISLNGERLEAGDYTLEMTAASMGEEWHWTRDFKIDGDIAKKLNDSDVTIQKDYTWLYVIIGGIVILLALILWVIIMRRKKKENEETRKQIANVDE
ncbi:DUF916 and DUF3324 domain-containing protein [Peribacillus simplex]|uniref:DUF916 and DUF3324 domain-containing protein n=1 Tax=Peribacillus simplex TaxID=1478 RepID=UPI00203B26E0|nr:DUF916 and DUF3324 domain-containing protein [Peribacillus simplex]MCM3675950.1 DUF916 and DUF3324 domain-containing protein [Peribacillus simplex]